MRTKKKLLANGIMYNTYLHIKREFLSIIENLYKGNEYSTWNESKKKGNKEFW